MWIKICANTSLEDALLAAQLGADAVGFVFAPSVRHVTPAEVARIAPKLPLSVERIGVFPPSDAEQIAHTARVAHLDAVQLHGYASPALLRELQGLLPQRVGLIEAVPWAVEQDAGSAAQASERMNEIRLRTPAARVLVDSKVGQASGGTGVAFDWSGARAVFDTAGSGLQLIVAGGLRAENVAHAIAALAPWGVDVASGVESSPGRKSPEKLAAFLQQARS